MAGFKFGVVRPIADTGTILHDLGLKRIPFGGAMSKELVAKQDLERIAMQEIRSFPGCEHVTEVEIEYQVDKVLKTNWTIHVFTREGGSMERIQYAINTTRKRLRHRYDLRTES